MHKTLAPGERGGSGLDRDATGDRGCQEKDVSFRSSVAWWPSDLVLSEICLALPLGSVTAVVGDVGAGDDQSC